jgi:methylmalonyl-CoA mutase C-terminal domain/subunit
VVDLLRAQVAEDVPVMVGGNIPRDDIAELKDLGVAAVFTPGAPVEEMVDFIRAAVPAASADAA